MKKGVLFVISAFIFGFNCFAGDVAHFEDMGFSSDNSQYMFAQYGVTDKKYQGYAEVYTVDIKKNEYIYEGVFRSPASSKTTKQNGKTVYTALLKRASSYIKKHGFSTSKSNPIYLLSADSKNEDTIEFRDFKSNSSENQFIYEVKLKSLVDGTGENAVSTFYILVEKKDMEGNLVCKKVCGSPTVERKGVVGYQVYEIISDNTGNNMIFVIEKHVVDKMGSSIRYMVETLVW